MMDYCEMANNGFDKIIKCCILTVGCHGNSIFGVELPFFNIYFFKLYFPSDGLNNC